jgi:hypothetical protein
VSLKFFGFGGASALHCCGLVSATSFASASLLRAESGRSLGEDALLLLRGGRTGCRAVPVGTCVSGRFDGDGGRGG